MKTLRKLRFSFFPLFFLMTCNWGLPPHPDPDDPGLYVLTSHGSHVASCYINDKPFANTNFYILQKDTGANSITTLKLSWQLMVHDSVFENTPYDSISFSLPVPASFNQTDLLKLDGQRFLNSVPVILNDTLQHKLSGIGTLYFVSVKENAGYNNDKYFVLSGLFDANIGDSIFVSKGRFDFEFNPGSLNF
ncbi:MAG: hypothetical protein ACTHNG_04935 [Ginsengibacter sp.]